MMMCSCYHQYFLHLGQTQVYPHVIKYVIGSHRQVNPNLLSHGRPRSARGNFGRPRPSPKLSARPKPAGSPRAGLARWQPSRATPLVCTNEIRSNIRMNMCGFSCIAYECSECRHECFRSHVRNCFQGFR